MPSAKIAKQEVGPQATAIADVLAPLPADTPVGGLPADSSFADTFLRNGLTLDRDAVERETVAAARALVAKHPQIDTIVFECTNLPPYKHAVQEALGLPVYDVLDLLKDFHARL